MVVIAAAVLMLRFTLGTDRVPKVTSPSSTLSFKPFTLQELLRLDVEIDIGTCGRKLRSPELEKMEKNVATVRELPLVKPVKFRGCSESIVRAEQTQSSEEENPAKEMEANRKLMVALGLIKPALNLQKTLTDVLTEQLAGSYDVKAKDVTIVEGKSSGSALDELTTAHEITHALQDQNFHLDKPPLEEKKYNGDNDLAVESLVEGDAMSSMVDYARKYMDVQKLVESEMQSSEVSSEELDKAPLYIRRSLLFPYEEGATFVKAVIEEKGTEGLDAAFKDPPLSSEQIMHPEKYLGRRENPRAVPLPDIASSLGRKWKLLKSDCMGEFDVAVWFRQFSGLLASEEVAGGWGGNTIQYYQGPGKDNVVVDSFVWDTPRDAAEFFDGYPRLLEKRFGSKTRTLKKAPSWYVLQAGGELFYCGLAGDGTLCVQAPDRQTLEKALKNFPRYPMATRTGS